MTEEESKRPTWDECVGKRLLIGLDFKSADVTEVRLHEVSPDKTLIKVQHLNGVLSWMKIGINVIIQVLPDTGPKTLQLYACGQCENRKCSMTVYESDDPYADEYNLPCTWVPGKETSFIRSG